MIDKFVEFAKSLIGIEEGTKEHREIIDLYNSYKPRPRGYTLKYTDPWCAGFVSACAIKNNMTNIIPIECSCSEMIKIAKKNNTFIKNNDYIPKTGDLIIFDWEGDHMPNHIGIVEKCEGFVIVTIEGNSNNKVSENTYKISDSRIYGYITPKYINADCSDWARTYWIKAINNGIVDGTNPKEPATREQVITILGRLNLL